MTVLMCPYCGFVFPEQARVDGLVPPHGSPGPLPGMGGCPGVGQAPRCPESDRRPLWNGEASPAQLRHYQ